MNALIAMMLKDLRLLLRDKMGFFFTLPFPLMMAVVFGSVFSGAGGAGTEGGSKIRIVVVDEDNTKASQKFVQSLKDASEFDARTEPDISAATEMVRLGKSGLVACVRVPKGYGEASERMFYGDPPTIEVRTDPSRKAEVGMFQGLLTKYAFMRFQEMFSDPAASRASAQKALASVRGSTEMDASSKSALESFLPQLDKFLENNAANQSAGGSGGGMGDWQPIKIETSEVTVTKKASPPNSFTISFPQGIIWGLIGCSMSLGLTLVTERTRGTLVRLRMAPLARWQVLAGKGLTCLVLTVGVTVVLLLIGLLPFFNVRAVAPLKLLAAIVCMGVCFTGLMMLLASIGRTEHAAAGLGWAVMLVFAMFGGGMMPLFLMPKWFQAVSSFSPIKWATQGMEGGLWRDAPWGQMMMICAVLLGVGAACFGVGAVIFSRSDRR